MLCRSFGYGHRLVICRVRSRLICVICFDIRVQAYLNSKLKSPLSAVSHFSFSNELCRTMSKFPARRPKREKLAFTCQQSLKTYLTWLSFCPRTPTYNSLIVCFNQLDWRSFCGQRQWIFGAKLGREPPNSLSLKSHPSMALKPPHPVGRFISYCI